MTTPRHILIAQSRYKVKGGEESVIEAERDLLRSRGHTVEILWRLNDDIQTMPKARLLGETLWSRPSQRLMLQAIAEQRPDIIHLHNIHPLLSPAIYWAIRRTGTPIVQTIHNFRWLCPQGMMLRHEQVCEDCVGRLPWRAVTRRCYRDSALQSAVLAATYALHTRIGSLHRNADRIIALTGFARDKLISGGLPADRLVIKGNFLEDPLQGAALPPDTDRNDRVLYVGRLSEEKGIQVLVKAATALPATLFDVIGQGPLELPRPDNVTFHGFLDKARIHAAMRRSALLVLPSLCYEGMPMVLIEAYANGLPVLASRLGALADLVEDGVTGLLFNPGDTDDLAAKLRWVQAHPDKIRQMGLRAREKYLAHYTAGRNYERLMQIYAEAAAHRARPHPTSC